MATGQARTWQGAHSSGTETSARKRNRPERTPRHVYFGHCGREASLGEEAEPAGEDRPPRVPGALRRRRASRGSNTRRNCSDAEGSRAKHGQALAKYRPEIVKETYRRRLLIISDPCWGVGECVGVVRCWSNAWSSAGQILTLIYNHILRQILVKYWSNTGSGTDMRPDTAADTGQILVKV